MNLLLLKVTIQRCFLCYFRLVILIFYNYSILSSSRYEQDLRHPGLSEILLVNSCSILHFDSRIVSQVIFCSGYVEPVRLGHLFYHALITFSVPQTLVLVVFIIGTPCPCFAADMNYGITSRNSVGNCIRIIKAASL